MAQETVHDKAFDVLPKGKTYFFIWRIRDFALVPVPSEDYGTFFKGDSYIVICCSQERTDGHSRMSSVALRDGQQGFVDIHFWIGSKSSQDEAGVAAIKSIELDDFLGGYPIQHRETEGNESQQFLSYFRTGIRLCNGGFESGFNKVVDELQPALFQIKGKKRPIMSELNEIGWSSMNDGDVFVLVAKKSIFIWTGSKSNLMERITANRIANELKDELSRFKLSLVIVEDGKEEKHLSDSENEDFSAFLPLDKKKAELRSGSGGQLDYFLSDEKFEAHERAVVKLYRCKEKDNGQIDTEHIKDGPLDKTDLDSNDTFIVDNRNSGIWVWVGHEATKRERSSALRYGLELIKENGYPNDTEIHKMVEHGETIEFKSLFRAWDKEAARVARSRTETRLFRLATSGKFEQVIGFEQDDLEEDSVMILDTGNKIWIWMSEEAQTKVPDESRQVRVGHLFLKQDHSGRRLDADQFVVVKQGSEPEAFTSNFPAWN